MRMLVASVPVLAATTSLAMAEPVTPTDTAPADHKNFAAAEAAAPNGTGPVDLTDAQMDDVYAGAPPFFFPPTFQSFIGACVLGGNPFCDGDPD